MKSKTFFISGASRGIGEAIALKLASGGANIIIAAKSVQEDPRLGGTIYSVAERVEQLGGQALSVPCDIRDEAQVKSAVEWGASHFGGIDACINNASAIQLAGTELLDLKKFDLMHAINVRGTFTVTKCCIPYLKKSSNPHILTLSPPLNLSPAWLGPFIGYTLSKYSMTLMTLGWAEEFRSFGIAANTLWPATTIATAAVKNLLGGQDVVNRSRNPEIVADAAYAILRRNSRSCSGNTFLDEQVLTEEGSNDFSKYSMDPGQPLKKDLFLD